MPDAKFTGSTKPQPGRPDPNPMGDKPKNFVLPPEPPDPPPGSKKLKANVRPGDKPPGG